MSTTTWLVIGGVALLAVAVIALQQRQGAPRVVASTLSVSGGGDPARTSALTSVYSSALTLFGSERRAVIGSQTQFQLAQLANDRARQLADVQLQIARQQRGAQREQAIIGGISRVVSSLNPLSWF
jgi:DNA-binding transcriptional regulator YbjK